MINKILKIENAYFFAMLLCIGQSFISIEELQSYNHSSIIFVVLHQFSIYHLPPIIAYFVTIYLIKNIIPPKIKDKKKHILMNTLLPLFFVFVIGAMMLGAGVLLNKTHFSYKIKLEQFCKLQQDFKKCYQYTGSKKKFDLLSEEQQFETLKYLTNNLMNELPKLQMQVSEAELQQINLKQIEAFEYIKTNNVREAYKSLFSIRWNKFY